MKKSVVLLITLISISLFSCKDSNKKEKIDLSKTPRPEIVIHRYETALFSIPQNNFVKGLDSISQEFEIFLGDNYQLEQNQVQLLEFINTPQHQDAWKIVQQKYADLSWMKNDLSSAFQRILYFYPEINVPVIYTYISGFDWEASLYLINDTIIFGLDNFLGKDFPVYTQLQIPQYISFRMDQPYILPMIIKTWEEENLLSEEKPKQLIDYMIYCGKELYFLDIILPDVSDEIKMGYLPEKLMFCLNNEQNIWRYMIEKDILFTTDYNMIRNFIQETPYTGGLMLESPGRLGQWIGWQIVRSYMKNNPEITLQALMSDKDAKKILGKSKYKPK